jgi:hypothetical protein
LLFAKDKRIKLPGSSLSFASYDKITNRLQPGVSGNYPLPVIFIATRYDEFISVPYTRSTEEAMDLADRLLTGRIIREFDFGADIIDKEVRYYETPDGLLLDALITTNERIDAAVPVGDILLPDGFVVESEDAFEPYE